MATTTATKNQNPDFINPRLKCNENGIWVVHYTVKGAGRYHSRRLSTGQAGRREAEAWLAGLMDGEEATAAVVDIPTIADFIGAYELYLSAHRPHADTQRICLKHLRKGLGAIRAGALTDKKLHQYMNDRKVAAPTLRRELGCLRAVYSYAVKTKRLAAGDVPFIELPRASIPRNVFLNKNEEADFFSKALAIVDENGRLSRLARFVALALCTAARRTAILELRWSQVDLVSGVVDYRVAGAEAHNKKRALVPVSDRLAPILKRMYDERLTGCDFVLDHDGPIRSEWERFTIAAGYPHLHVHDMRRTWCSLALQAGADLMGVSQVMADDPATIAKHYAQFASDSARKAVNARA